MLSAIISAALLQVTLPPHASPARGGTAALVDSLEAATLRFVHEWREVFRVSSIARGDHRSVALSVTNAQSPSGLRTAYLFCNPGRIGVRDDRAIVSDASFYLACPSWALSDSLPYNAGRDVDAGIDQRYRPAVRQGRASLIGVFDAAARSLPENDWVVGQRVRLLVDQHENDRALAATGECTPDRAWCSQLRAYVLATRGEVAAADSAFAQAARQMPLSERCKWTDLSLLLDGATREAYAPIPCDKRDSVNQRIWWLADPLYIDAGNERRVEHFARLVAIAIRSALDRDEWFDWRSETGADALRETITRYGWPSYVWPYSLFEVGYRGYPNFSVTRAANSTLEYTAGRLQTIPAWRAISAPFGSRRDDWSIADPQIPMERFVYDDDPKRRAVVEHALRVSPWWPQQHFLPREPLVQLPEGQIALLRRQTNALLAVATDLDSTSLIRRSGERVDATLLLTHEPGSWRQVVRSSGTVGAPFVLHGPVDTRATLVGVEFTAAGASGPPGGRTRFGITPPPPLVAMKPGDLAISDPVLLIAPADGAELPQATEQVLARMAGSTRLQRGARVGVYWETYGIASTDSVEIAVWIERHTPQGILRRFGNALSVTTDLNTPVVQSWTESQLGRNAHVIPGPVAIIGRSIVLDASRLPPGEYWLDVVVRKAGSEPLRGRRAFTVPAQ